MILPASRFRRSEDFEPAIILTVCVGAWAVFASLPLNHDSSWYLDASKRWIEGQQLYTDVMEINPPLAFYETVGLSLGLLTKKAFVGGVCGAVALSSLWCARLSRSGLICLAALLIGGLPAFGQRDHLAIIFALPYLMAGKTGRREGIALGLVAFLGVGLKPHFLLIPLLATLGRAIQARTWREIFTSANWALGLACVAYVSFVWLAHPAYFAEMIPLGQAVYDAYGVPVLNQPLIWAGLAVALCGLRVGTLPLALSLLGATGAYVLQGKGWTYQLIPSATLTLILGWSLWRQIAPPMRVLAASGAIFSAALLMSGGPYQRVAPIPVPKGTKVLFLSVRVSAAYPMVQEAGSINTSRYPAIWPVPGAWRTLQDPAASETRKAKAREILAETRHNIVSDILAGQPVAIFADSSPRQLYFDGPFDWIAFISADPRFHGYDEAKPLGPYRVLLRRK